MDRRVTPARSDLAADHLRGQILADRYVKGEAAIVTAPILDLRARPDAAASLETQALYGEAVQVYEREDGWNWIQLSSDGYVGYARGDGLAAHLSAPPDGRVSALRAPVFSRADLKSPVRCFLPMNARVARGAREGDYVKIGEDAWISARHVAAMSEPEADWVAVAERMLGAPYLWGGKTPDGLDCSGLIQTAMHAAGLECPRDTDMQERALGSPLASGAEMRRGDLLFWKGHTGVMRNATELLHANAYHMAVAVEPVDEALARIASKGTPVTSMKRLPDRQ